LSLFGREECFYKNLKHKQDLEAAAIEAVYDFTAQEREPDSENELYDHPTQVILEWIGLAGINKRGQERFQLSIGSDLATNKRSTPLRVL